MAEEKNSTTKKSTAKSEAVEEVKVEKRFCTRCGKELKEGEVCDCEASAPASSNATVNGDAIVNTIKDIWSTIIGVFKRPATTISEEANAKGSNKVIILTILLAISFAFYLMATTAGYARSINNATSLLTITEWEPPYFQIFIYGILIYAIMAILPVVAALVVAKIAKNANYTFGKSFKLYITSNAPLILGYLGMTLILLLNVNLLTVLGTIAFAIIGVFCFFNFILSFNSEVKMKDDRRSYAITGLMAFWFIMLVVVVLLVGATIASSIVGEVNSNLNNYSDPFNW